MVQLICSSIPKEKKKKSCFFAPAPLLAEIGTGRRTRAKRIYKLIIYSWMIQLQAVGKDIYKMFLDCQPYFCWQIFYFLFFFKVYNESYYSSTHTPGTVPHKHYIKDWCHLPVAGMQQVIPRQAQQQLAVAFCPSLSSSAFRPVPTDRSTAHAPTARPAVPRGAQQPADPAALEHASIWLSWQVLQQSYS